MFGALVVILVIGVAVFAQVKDCPLRDEPLIVMTTDSEDKVAS
ncbi:MAG: hypothetical protein ACHQRJ_15875 [Alphaproteobacteria bacterium]